MALSKTEAIEINRLLRWVLYRDQPEFGRLGRVTTEAEARDAAAYLAERANKVLHAGLRRDVVERDWKLP